MTLIAERPTVAQPLPWTLPPVERDRLASGLEVAGCDVPGLPMAAAVLVVHGGAAAEPVSQAGVTQLLGELLTHRTERYSQPQLAVALESVGATLGAGASFSALSMSVTAPTSVFGRAVELLAEVALRPAFEADDVEAAKHRELTAIELEASFPGYLAIELLPPAIFTRATPYSRRLGGSAATLAAIDHKSVEVTYYSLLERVPCTLVVVGDFEAIDVDEAADYFASLVPATDELPVAFDARPGPRPVYLVDFPGAVQSAISVGHAGPARHIHDEAALETLQHILGGTSQGRLDRALREERGYTYSVAAGFSRWRDGGLFMVHTTVQNDATGPAAREIVDQLRQIREGRVEAGELDQALRALTGQFPLDFQSAQGIASLTADVALHDLPADYLDAKRTRLATISAAEVATAAHRYLHPDDLTMVVVGDADAVQPQLEAAGVGEVVRTTAAALRAANGNGV